MTFEQNKNKALLKEFIKESQAQQKPYHRSTGLKAYMLSKKYGLCEIKSILPEPKYFARKQSYEVVYSLVTTSECTSSVFPKERLLELLKSMADIERNYPEYLI